MSFFDWFSKKEEKKEIHKFDDEERKLSLDSRRQKAEIQRLQADLEIQQMRLRAELEKVKLNAEIEDQKQRLAELLDNGEEEEQTSMNTEDMLAGSLFGLIAKGMQQQPQQQPIQQAQQQQISVSDEEIKAMILQFKQENSMQFNLAKNLSDESLYNIIRNRISIDEVTAKRAVQIFRSI